MLFRKFLENLKLNSPSHILSNHPYFNYSNFGVEIEFITFSVPKNDFKSYWLVEFLQGSDYEYHVKKLFAEKNPDFDPEDDDLDEQDFVDYVEKNKDEVLEEYLQRVQDGHDRGENWDSASKNILKYWQTKVYDIVKDSGYKVSLNTPGGVFWDIGYDGTDSIMSMPVLELRTGILKNTPSEMSKFGKFLHNLSTSLKQNKEYLSAAENTGIHVHVSNPQTGRANGYVDGFARLSVMVGMDEDGIWDDQAPLNRDFASYARLNRMSDFESHSSTGAYDHVVLWLERIVRAHGNVVSNELLGSYLTGLIRNQGVNVQSEYPTVEYRHLASKTLVDSNGVDRVMNFIVYAMKNAAGRVKKDRLVIPDKYGKMAMLTRLPGDKVRIEIRMADKPWRSPKSGYPNKDRQYPPGNERMPNEPISQWVKRTRPAKEEPPKRRTDLTDFERMFDT